MYRIALWLTVLLLALVAAGCGGGSEEPASAPAIPRTLAQRLADQADAIAATYESGDQCAAAHEADDFLAAARQAVETGRIPPELQDQLLTAANDVVNEINCPVTTTDVQPDCNQLEEQLNALEAEKKDTKGKGKDRRLQEEIDSLAQQLEDCNGGRGEEGDD